MLGGLQLVSVLKMVATSFGIIHLYLLGINELLTPMVGRGLDVQ
jgi:hypothetical protein